MLPPSDLAQALDAIGLQEYTEVLQREGFETWQQLRDITENDMVTLGIKLGHRRRLQRAIQEANQQAPDGILLHPQSHSPEQSRQYQQSSQQQPDSYNSTQSLAQPQTGPPQKRKYRRHPKPDDNAPERPPSAYVIFSNRIRERLEGQELSFTEIAKMVGEQWQDPDPEERAACERQAQSMKETYYAQLSEYKKTPEYLVYQAYLAEFKVKHGDKAAKDVKKPKTAYDTDVSTTRSNSDEGTLNGRSPKTVGMSISTHTPSTQTGLVDRFPNDRVNGQSSRPTHSNASSPRVRRPESLYSDSSTLSASHYGATLPNIEDRRWDPHTMPYRQQFANWPVTMDGSPREPLISPLVNTFPSHAGPISHAITRSSWTNSSDTHHLRRNSGIDPRLFPSSNVSLDSGRRTLPPPVIGFAAGPIQPDYLRASRSAPNSAPQAAVPLGGHDERSTLSLPPIRTQVEERDDEGG
ncbi:putative non-histone chromosomal protein 6B [Elsinoe fawcettii]|nr:putative non-histone chromosomal protein 6B [Elsinoe fawcettii]